jgi:acylphosphatase
MQRRVHVVVSGRVQGVFFRVGCAREARARGVGGWVANRPDGAVEAVFEGPTDQVEALLGWCRAGPPSARVDEVVISEEPPSGDRAFSVR